MGDRFLSSAGTNGENCALPMRLPDHSPALDKNRAPMGPESLSSTGAGVWRKAPMAFPDSSSVLDKFQSARRALNGTCLMARAGESEEQQKTAKKNCQKTAGTFLCVPLGMCS